MYVLDVIRQVEPRNLYRFVIRKQAETNLDSVYVHKLSWRRNTIEFSPA